MILCYIDESGTPEIPGTTSHFILCGLTIPVYKWKMCEYEIQGIKSNFGLLHKEIHTAWILKVYPEQNKIEDFDKLSRDDRIFEVKKLRNQKLQKLQKSQKSKSYHQHKKNFRKTEDYIHLTHSERKQLMEELAKMIGGWGFARIFSECIDKTYFNPAKSRLTVAEQAFEQVVSRVERYLENTKQNSEDNFGMLIHDNNPTVAKRLTELMKSFHEKGTFFTTIRNIIETPLFVDSELTNMVQMSDLSAYALRRYCENKETWLFDLIYSRADRAYERVVGIRHFTKSNCTCRICQDHSSGDSTK